VGRAFALASIIALAACSNASQQRTNVTTTSTASSATAGITTYGASLPPGLELTALRTNCEICHSGDMYATQRLSKTVWDAEVTKMIGFGAPLPKSQQVAVVNYLARYLGPNVPRVKVVPVVTAPPISYSGPPADPSR
jgi:hypothetical protein